MADLIEESLIVGFGELETELLPRLLKRVFHVTTVESYARILSDGAVKSNRDAAFGFTFEASERSYFRKKGCVSVFDLRTVPYEEMQFQRCAKYNFLNPPFSNNKPVFLFLNGSCFKRLIPWTTANEEEGYSAMVIPYLEAGYPGEIPMSRIERVLRVDVEPNASTEPDPVISFLRGLR